MSECICNHCANKYICEDDYCEKYEEWFCAAWEETIRMIRGQEAADDGNC